MKQPAMETSNQQNPQIKCQKLQIFQKIQTNFAVVGISPELVTQSYPMNGKIFMGFLSMGSGFIFMCVYTFYYAQTFAEYTQSIYISAVAFLILTILTIIILNAEKLFNLINYGESIANTSKC